MTSTSKNSPMHGSRPLLTLAGLLATTLAACGSPAKYVAPDGGLAGIGGPASAGASGHPDAATDTAPGTGGTPASGSGGRDLGSGGSGIGAPAAMASAARPQPRVESPGQARAGQAQHRAESAGARPRQGRREWEPVVSRPREGRQGGPEVPPWAAVSERVAYWVPAESSALAASSALVA